MTDRSRPEYRIEFSIQRQGDADADFKQTGSVLAREWGIPGKGDDASRRPDVFSRRYPRRSLQSAACSPPM